MYNYNMPRQAQYNQPVQGYDQKPSDPMEHIRQAERRTLKKTSSGLGFFVLAYFLTMDVVAIVLMTVIEVLDFDVQEPTLMYLLDIFLSVNAAFIPGLVYLGASGFRISSAFKRTYVPLTLLIPIVFMGMAIATVSNYAARLFDSNLNIFGLENSVSMTNDALLDPLQIVLYIIATAAVPAFAEEFAFRGIVMGRLRKYGNCFAIVASAVMFGAMHANTTQIVFAFILGLVFGYIDCVTESIIPSITVHFLNNFYAVIFEILRNNTNVDENIYLIVNLAVLVIFCLGGLLSFIYLAKRDKSFFKLSSKDKSPDEYADLIPYKEKFKSFFLTPGVLFALSALLVITIYFLIPQ